MSNEVEFVQLSLFDNPITFLQKENDELSLSDEKVFVLQTIFEANSASLPMRVRNGLHSLLNHKYTDFTEFIVCLHDNMIRSDNKTNMGASSKAALHAFLMEFRKAVCQILAQEEVPLELAVCCSELLLLSRFGMSPSDASTVAQRFPDAYVRPPLFIIIQHYINQDTSTSVLWHNHISFSPNQKIKMLADSAIMLGISSERVRQKRSVALDELARLLEPSAAPAQQWRSRYESIFLFEGKALEEAIFKMEGVAFNSNFIKLIFSFINPSYALVCNNAQNFFKPSDRQVTVHLVGRHLLDYFRFEDCFNTIQTELQQPRKDAETRNAYDFHLNYYLGEAPEEVENEVYLLFTKVLECNYTISVDGPQMTLPANVMKTIPELIEDIFKRENRIMSLDELYEEFECCHPGMTKSKQALRGSLNTSPLFTPISRSSRYALKEWTDSERRGGSIRELAKEFLSANDHPQRAKDITSYINSCRRNTSAGNVYTNLFLDESGTFAFFYYKKKLYVGLSDKNYSELYVRKK